MYMILHYKYTLFYKKKEKKSHDMFFKVFTIFNSSEGKKTVKYKLQQVALFEGLQVVLCTLKQHKAQKV